MNSRSQRAVALLALVGVAAACGAEQAKNDPNRPAVVEAPPIVLPSDTAKVDSMPAFRERVAQLTAELAREYALLGAAMVLDDRRMIAAPYADGAILTIGDSSYTGKTAISFALADFARRNSLKDMTRTTRAIATVDSTVVDSGSYIVRGQRPGGALEQSTGRYIAVWLHHADNQWVLRRDSIMPASRPKSR